MGVKCSVYKTTDKNGKSYWAYKIKDPDTGAYGGEYRLHPLQKKLGIASMKISSKQDGYKVISMADEAGMFEKRDSEVEMLMKTPIVDYLRMYWDWKNSPVLKAENERNPGSIHEDYATKSYRSLVNYVLPIDPVDPPRVTGSFPRLSRNLLCPQINKDHVQQIQDAIMRQKKIYTWMGVEDALHRPLRDLVKKGVLKENPLKLMERVKPSCHRSPKRGALDTDEMERLLQIMDQHSSKPYHVRIHVKHEKGKRAGQEYDVKRYQQLDRRVFLAVAFSGYAGPRMGELQALQVGRISKPKNSVSDDVLVAEICEAYARKAGFKSPKNGDSRKAPIPLWLADEMIAFGNRNPWGEKLIFYSDKVSGKPIDHKVISDGFNQEVAYMLGLCLVDDYMREDPNNYYQEIIEAGEAERKNRRIVFHSERRYFNALAVSKLGRDKARGIIGHKTEEMTDLYFNQQPRELQSDGVKLFEDVQNPLVV